MKIGDLSLQTGCNIETIRYYERIGILPIAARRGRYRSYGPDDVGRLRFIRRARELGFTLDEVRTLLGLAEDIDNSCGDVRILAARHLTVVERKIQDLQRMERELRDSVHACDTGGTAGCPLIDSLYAKPDHLPI